MGTQPRIVERAEQPFLGVRGRVTWSAFGLIADRLPEIVGLLAERGIAPADGPFFKYELINPSDPEQELHVVAGVPVHERVRLPHSDVFYGTLPAGRYATVQHTGHPDRLLTVAATLLKWGHAKGLKWDMVRTEEGEVWGCRLETYHTDPRLEPDLEKWQMELSLRLADQ
ncbi:GyrI-like domain-containing protein [Streptomyces sp. KLOTTS4A1]|uniref:GyrI-like domain-containing protein n=1 Tax=Streptomyces sp. KLOTTS4A1 TaxID=3390996 RepID=UPI0039F4734A